MSLADLHARGMLPATTQTVVRTSVADVLESNCREVFEYWDHLRGQRLAPSWSEFHLEELSPRTIPYIRVVDVDLRAFDIRYRYWGTGLVRVLGQDRTGRTLSGLPLSRAKQALDEYKTVVEDKAPYALIYNATTSKNAYPLYAPAIRLPLMDDRETVNIIVAYADFQADQEKWGARLRAQAEPGDPA